MDDIRVTISSSSPRLLDQIRLHMRKNGLAYRTGQTYIHWVKRFIYFHNNQYPKVIGAKHIEDFLADLSNTRYCSVNTQYTAFFFLEGPFFEKYWVLLRKIYNKKQLGSAGTG